MVKTQATPSGAAPSRPSRRLRREARTVELMIRMYCRDNHAVAGPSAEATSPNSAAPRTGDSRRPPLCPDCAALLDYSLDRIEACRFGAGKPTCARCTVHCFRPAMREQIKAAMRYSGPRMAYRHPYLAMRHLMDRRQEPREGP